MGFGWSREQDSYRRGVRSAPNAPASILAYMHVAALLDPA